MNSDWGHFDLFCQSGLFIATIDFVCIPWSLVVSAGMPSLIGRPQSDFSVISCILLVEHLIKLGSASESGLFVLVVLYFAICLLSACWID